MEHEKLYNFLHKAVNDSYDYEIRHWRKLIDNRLDDCELIAVCIFALGGLFLSYYLMRQHYPPVMYSFMGAGFAFGGYHTFKAFGIYEVITKNMSRLAAAQDRLHSFFLAERRRLCDELYAHRSDYEYLKIFYSEEKYKAPSLTLLWDLTEGRKKLVMEDRERI
ncbi:hypothetical protein [Pseudidiomarina homiensis]|uniref:Uncharacterized protein n=1 Tax=Pseudidiomarina homiensis TaxID=364198 RepID=A0A432XUF2_9GAMM|nr:hypothetical protein [Pseudidiomarina homiensis]RUO52368.1 hypothetical protein CWI70_11625 [Pseudidiomarina homiensis]